MIGNKTIGEPMRKKCLLSDESIHNGLIKRITREDLPCCLEIIHRSFKTVAKEFGLTKENCQGHTSFMEMDKLQNFYDWGFLMFGLYEKNALVGYFSLSQKEGKIYELHNLAILPEVRHKGYGKILLNYAKQEVINLDGNKIKIGIIEESHVLKNWYLLNDFVHIGTKKFEHLPFTVGFMEWEKS